MRSSFPPPSRLAALLLGLGACARGPAGPPPNVLLISLDSTRRDILSCYGHVPPHAPQVATCPQIDRLAAEGVRFEQAYATTSWTLPSHMTLMTGLPELAHAVELDNLELAEEHVTLAETLQRNGYRTAGFYSGPYLHPSFGFGRGFDRYRACWGAELEQALAELERVEADEAALPQDAGLAEREAVYLRKKAVADSIHGASHVDVTSPMLTRAALAELAEARVQERPWFLFVHYFDPHYDYVPPGDHGTRFDPDYAGDLDGRDFIDNPRVCEPMSPPPVTDPKAHRRNIGERDLEHVRALYDGELSWTDEQLGLLLDDLREAGELDRTLVIVLSDHGDEFFEHGNIGHRKNLYEESVRIPLVMRYPRGLPRGKVARGVVTLADVPATIYELTGITPPQELPARSLVGLAHGREPEDGERRALGRLVDVRELTNSQDPGSVAMQVLIDESFLDWPIKIHRRRYRIEPLGAGRPQGTLPGPPPGTNGELRTVDFMRWIDVERYPTEPLDKYSASFEEPRARAALIEFDRWYRRLLARRALPSLAAEGVNPQMLDALGYGGGLGFDDASMIERFTLEPPLDPP